VWVSFACVFQTLAVFTGRSFRIIFSRVIHRQVPEFVSHPVAQPILASTQVSVDVYASTGEVSEHFAAHPGRHVELVHLGGIEVLPVRHKDDSAWKNIRLHDLNLGTQQ